MRDTVEVARGRWPAILAALGVHESFLRNQHGPCPLGCGGKRSYRFDDRLNGSWICTHCGAGDGFDLLQKLHDRTFREVADMVDSVVGSAVATPAKPEATEAEKTAAIRRLLQGAGRVVESTPAGRWLARRCGPVPQALLGDLRAHPGIRHSTSGGLHPAMLAIMRYPDGTGASLHRTFLTPDGEKAPVDPVRMIMSGRPLAGSAVRLGPVAEHIGIAEGIETALSAGILFGLSVWAAISAGGVKAWEPPAGVRKVTIFADNDASFTGQAAAFALAHRLVTSCGLEASVKVPPSPGTDWNDYLHEREAA